METVTTQPLAGTQYPKTLTPLQAASALGVSRPRLYEMMRVGRLEVVRVGGRVFVTEESLEALAQERLRRAEREVERLNKAVVK